MGRKQRESEGGGGGGGGGFVLLTLLAMGVISCCMVYAYLSDSDHISSETKRQEPPPPPPPPPSCCRGIEHLELWGEPVNWGSDFKLNSSQDCCMACKNSCSHKQRQEQQQQQRSSMPCTCHSWVFCGDPQACGTRFGECWLKKQRKSLELDPRESGDYVMWTSGFIFPKGEDFIGLETEYGFLRIQLFPDCAPNSVAYILELFQWRDSSSGSQFYRAESRGSFWDSQGNHIENAEFGPPFGLIQGRIEPRGTLFKAVPQEWSPPIKRGSVAWVGSGPDFFISLANHFEWKKPYTVFGQLLPQDIDIAESISRLPTKTEVWSDVVVSVLERPVPLRFRSVETSRDNLKLF